MNLTDFFPYLMPQAKGVPDPVAEFNIRLALIELCQRSLIWREYQPAITTDGLATTFSYTPAANQQIVKLISMTLAGDDIPVVDPKIGKSLDSSADTSAYAYGGFSAFELRPLQVAGVAVITYSAVAPSIAALTVPDSFGRYAEQVARGALYRLQATKGRDYSDQSASVFTKQMWEDDIGGAKHDAFLGFARTTPRTAPAWF